jgi:hypothetical protein
MTNQTPYEIHHPTLKPQNVSSFTRICFIPYGYNLSSYVKEQYSSNLIKSCWKVFVESPMSLDVISEFFPREESETIKQKTQITGLPKMDFLKQFLDEYNADHKPFDKLWNYPRLAKKKRIIWAPHWSVYWGNTIGFCTFHIFATHMHSILQSNPDIDCVLRLHPMTINNLIQTRIFDMELSNQLMSVLESLPNLRIDNSLNYLDLFASSDALITDGISFLAEYAPTHKPILHTSNHGRPSLNCFGEALIANYYQAQSSCEIDQFIQDVILKNNDQMKEQRTNSIKNILGDCNTSVANTITNFLKGNL